MSETSSIDLFIAYAQADADLLERLRIQLRAVERIGLVDAWHDGEIEVGSNREEAIMKALKDAEIILLLVSADFIASEFSYEKEVKEAMKLHELGQAVVIPVILKDCSWQYTPFAKLKVLPQNGIPVTNEHWKTTDRAFQQVIIEVVRISNAMRADKDISTIRSEVKETSTTTVTQEKTISYSKTIEKNKPAPTPTKKDNSFLKYAALFFGTVILVAFLFKQFGSSNETDKPITENISVKEKTEERSNPTTVNPTTTKENSSRVNLPSISINGLNWTSTNLTTVSPDGSWCPNNQESNCDQYGRLYLFKNALNICPQGWRLPSKAEWQALTKGDINQLQLSKSGVYDKSFRDLGRKAYYWSADRAGGGEAWCFEFMNEGSARVERRYVHWGLACRCVEK